MNEPTVETSPAIKVTVRISRKQMWENFMQQMSMFIWDNKILQYDEIQKVYRFLVGDGPLHYSAIGVRNLFADGMTPLLLGEAMLNFEPRQDGLPILMEVIVEDGENESVLIPHKFIHF